MGLKKFNAKKEIKKLKRRSNKLKRVGVIGAIIGTIFIISSYALYSYTGSSVAFNSPINKRVKTTVTAENGTVESLSGKILSEEIKTNPKFSASHSDKGLYVQEGDKTKSIDGKPTYYYRGNVENNYVKFAGLKWRIIRVNEDGSIRLISLFDTGKDIGSIYTNANSGNYNESEVKKIVDNWYNSLSSENKNLIVKSEFCNDTSIQASQRLGNKPSFACPNGTKLQLNAGIISGDEVIYSGATLSNYSSTYLNQGPTENTDGGWFWTMTQATNTSMYIDLSNITKGNGLWDWTSGFSNNRGVKYVINLKEGTQVTGEGTSGTPYEVVGSIDQIQKEGDYKVSQTFTITPNEGYVYGSVSCTNNAQASYNKETKTLTVSNQTQDTTCTVKFEKLKILKDAILASHNITKPTTTPGAQVSATNEKVLAEAEDDYGTSYYFRGAITDNYVNFAGFTWRVVRINGDGSIRLILDGTLGKVYYNGVLKTDIESKVRYNDTYNVNKYVGYSYDATSDDANTKVTKSSTDSTIKAAVDKFYEKYLKKYENVLSDSIYCNDRSVYSGTGKGTNTTKYGATKRKENNSVTLKCPQQNDRYTVSDTVKGNGALKYPIGLLTYDELVYAGAYYQQRNDSYYLYNSLINGNNYYTMTPEAFQLATGGNSITIYYSELGWSVAGSTIIYGGIAIRPVINLKADTQVTGEGTSDNPYQVQ